jgi:hypothetical protein
MMKFVLTPKQDGYYGLKIDSVVSPVDEATLQYILNDKFYDECGIKKHNDKYIVSLKNGTKFSVIEKDEFLSKLQDAYKEVSENSTNSNFEIGNNQ